MGAGRLLSGWIAREFETKAFYCEFCMRDYLACRLHPLRRWAAKNKYRVRP